MLSLEVSQGSDSGFLLPSAHLTAEPGSPYQKQVTLHRVAASEGDLQDGALSEQGVGGVHHVVLQAQALIYLPQALQPLLEMGHTSAYAGQGPSFLIMCLVGMGGGSRRQGGSVGQVPRARSMHLGNAPHPCQDGLLTISAMAALECCAAEKIMSSAPSKGARMQLLLETCRLGRHNMAWGTCHNHHQAQHSPAHADQHSEGLEGRNHLGEGHRDPREAVVRCMTSAIISASEQSQT